MMAPSGAGIAFALDLEHHPGKAIYEKMCIDCHAKDGGGVEGKADDPLVGARTLESLAERIDRTMPEDQPELLNAEESKTVAAYIYDAFYSAEARARNTPARIDLSRLTVPQYRNSVADLVLGFRGDNWISEKRGLKASYFGDRGHNERKEFREQKKPDKFERIDGTVKFDFGEGIPKHAEVKEFSPEQFSIRWEGTILPEETGVHEFVVKTRNGVTLWVNDHDRGEESDQKTIDGWVVPHNEVREETGRVFLIGGRPYPIRLDFFTYKEKAASVELLWKPPHGILRRSRNATSCPSGRTSPSSSTFPFPPTTAVSATSAARWSRRRGSSPSPPVPRWPRTTSSITSTSSRRSSARSPRPNVRRRSTPSPRPSSPAPSAVLSPTRRRSVLSGSTSRGVPRPSRP
jgi:hypothetical protein